MVKDIPEHLTTRDSFRKSKASFKDSIEGREFFFSCTKSKKNVAEVYDVDTGILIAVSVKGTGYLQEWVKQNMEEIKNRLSEYTYKEPDLFS